MVKVFEDRNFIILSGSCKRSSSYILFNKNKLFKEGHTHLNNYKTAIWLSKLCTSKKLPLNLSSDYLLESLMRISDDESYTNKISELRELRKKKSHNYYINVQKGVKRKSKRK